MLAAAEEIAEELLDGPADDLSDVAAGLALIDGVLAVFTMVLAKPPAPEARAPQGRGQKRGGRFCGWHAPGV